MKDDEHEKPPSNRDRMSDQADAAHEAAIARMQNDVHYANRFHALKAKATNPHDMVGYRVIRPVTQPVLNVQAETQADTRETETVPTEAVSPPQTQESHDEQKREEPRVVASGSEAGAASVSPSPSSANVLPEALAPSSEPRHATVEIRSEVVSHRQGSNKNLWIGIVIAAVMACGLLVLLWPRERGEQAKEASTVATMTPIEPTSTAPSVKPGLTAEPAALTTAEPATSIRKASPSSEKPQIKNPPSAPASAIPEASVSMPKPNNSTPAPSSKIPWYE